MKQPVCHPSPTLAIFGLLVSTLACSPSSDAQSEADSETGTSTDSETGTDSEGEPEPEVLPPRCKAPEGMGKPATIAETLALINALPEPITVACVVQSLDRPLAINVTTSNFSAQPAVDEHSPRIFIFSGNLVLSVVPDGTGQNLLEFGQPMGNGESLKGELEMPVMQPVFSNKPFDHLRYNDKITVCGFCHRDEYLAPNGGHENAYISRSLRPVDSYAVSVDDLRTEHLDCDPNAEPERCAILSSIFSHGSVVHQDFPAELGTIFDP